MYVFSLKMSVFNLERANDPFKRRIRILQGSKSSNNFLFFYGGENRKFTNFTDCWHIGHVYFDVNPASALSGP